MTHINPGTDTTINPVVIDDSYREKKQQNLKSYTGAYVMYLSEGKIIVTGREKFKNFKAVFPVSEVEGFLSNTSAPSHPPEAQQRVDAIENLSTFEFAQMKGVIFIEKKAAIDALLQAGDHHE